MTLSRAIPCHRRRIENKDSETPIWRVTDWDASSCVLGYMTFRLFSHDGRYLFFASDRTGTFQLYRLDLEREEAVQVTGPGGVNPTSGIPTAGQWRDSNVHPLASQFAYATDRELFIADVETLEYRVLAACPPEWASLDATPQFSGDGKQFAAIYVTRDKRRGVAVGEVGSRPAQLKSVLLCEPGVHIGYLIAPPVTDRFILSVCYGTGDYQNEPTGSPERRARAWRLDPATGDFRPYLVMPPGFRATHQFFGPQGRLYFHRKTVGAWVPAAVASIDLEGGDYREHYSSPDRRLGHACIAPDGKWLVTDVQEPNHNELIHVDLATGASRIIWWPNSTCGKSQAGHVHPSSDFQGRRIAFQSDKDGNCAIYLANLS